MDWEYTPSEFESDDITNTKSNNIFEDNFIPPSPNWTFINKSFVSFSCWLLKKIFKFYSKRYFQINCDYEDVETVVKSTNSKKSLLNSNHQRSQSITTLPSQQSKERSSCTRRSFYSKFKSKLTQKQKITIKQNSESNLLNNKFSLKPVHRCSSWPANKNENEKEFLSSQ